MKVNDSVGFFALCRLRCVFLIDFLGTMFACGNSRDSVAAFFEKLARFLALAFKVGVVTTEVPKSKKLTEWEVK